jgi:hypothetical protein
VLKSSFFLIFMLFSSSSIVQHPVKLEGEGASDYELVSRSGHSRGPRKDQEPFQSEDKKPRCSMYPGPFCQMRSGMS